jgi:hypothetical protein
MPWCYISKWEGSHFSLPAQTHVSKKNTGRNSEMHRFWCISEFHPVFLSFVSSHPVFPTAPCVFDEHRVLTLAFWDFTDNFNNQWNIDNIYLSFGEIWNVSFDQFLLICLKFILQEVVTGSKWKRHAFFWDFSFPNIVPLMNGWTLLWTKNNMFQLFL